MRAPRGLQWKPGKAITSWLSLRDADGPVCAIVVVYVDDFMICGPMELVHELASVIQGVWDTSELTILGPECAVRFLGMELHRETETEEEIHIHQQGLSQELIQSGADPDRQYKAKSAGSCTDYQGVGGDTRSMQ